MKGLNNWFPVLVTAMIFVLVPPVMVPQPVIIDEAATVELNQTLATLSIGKTVQVI